MSIDEIEVVKNEITMAFEAYQSGNIFPLYIIIICLGLIITLLLVIYKIQSAQKNERMDRIESALEKMETQSMLQSNVVAGLERVTQSQQEMLNQLITKKLAS